MGASLIHLLVIFMKPELGRDASLEETKDLAAERAEPTF